MASSSLLDSKYFDKLLVNRLQAINVRGGKADIIMHFNGTKVDYYSLDEMSTIPVTSLIQGQHEVTLYRVTYSVNGLDFEAVYAVPDCVKTLDNVALILHCSTLPAALSSDNELKNRNDIFSYYLSLAGRASQIGLPVLLPNMYYSQTVGTKTAVQIGTTISTALEAIGVPSAANLYIIAQSSGGGALSIAMKLGTFDKYNVKYIDFAAVSSLFDINKFVSSPILQLSFINSQNFWANIIAFYWAAAVSGLGTKIPTETDFYNTAEAGLNGATDLISSMTLWGLPSVEPTITSVWREFRATNTDPYQKVPQFLKIIGASLSKLQSIASAAHKAVISTGNPFSITPLLTTSMIGNLSNILTFSQNGLDEFKNLLTLPSIGKFSMNTDINVIHYPTDTVVPFTSSPDPSIAKTDTGYNFKKAGFNVTEITSKSSIVKNFEAQGYTSVIDIPTDHSYAYYIESINAIVNYLKINKTTITKIVTFNGTEFDSYTLAEMQAAPAFSIIQGLQAVTVYRVTYTVTGLNPASMNTAYEYEALYAVPESASSLDNVILQVHGAGLPTTYSSATFFANRTDVSTHYLIIAAMASQTGLPVLFPNMFKSQEVPDKFASRMGLIASEALKAVGVPDNATLTVIGHSAGSLAIDNMFELGELSRYSVKHVYIAGTPGTVQVENNPINPFFTNPATPQQFWATFVTRFWLQIATLAGGPSEATFAATATVAMLSALYLISLLLSSGNSPTLEAALTATYKDLRATHINLVTFPATLGASIGAIDGSGAASALTAQATAVWNALVGASPGTEIAAIAGVISPTSIIGDFAFINPLGITQDIINEFILNVTFSPNNWPSTAKVTIVHYQADTTAPFVPPPAELNSSKQTEVGHYFDAAGIDVNEIVTKSTTMTNLQTSVTTTRFGPIEDHGLSWFGAMEVCVKDLIEERMKNA